MKTFRLQLAQLGLSMNKSSEASIDVEPDEADSDGNSNNSDELTCSGQANGTMETRASLVLAKLDINPSSAHMNPKATTIKQDEPNGPKVCSNVGGRKATAKPETESANLNRVLNLRKLTAGGGDGRLTSDEASSARPKRTDERAAPSDRHQVGSGSLSCIDARLSELIKRQSRFINSIPIVKVKSILSITLLINLMAACLVQAGFWTFYFPNFLKPSGYKELTGFIEQVEDSINATKDAFSDHQHFWGLMQKLDSVNRLELYPEESVCAEIFPIFRDLAIEYSYIDYDHFIKPLEAYRDHLLECRSKWYPEGEKIYNESSIDQSESLTVVYPLLKQNHNITVSAKNILPREWEQNLYEVELELKLHWLSKLTNENEYRDKRAKLVKIWDNIKRGLDTSLECVYMRYAYRQIAADINQFALDMNIKGMRQASEMLKSAYSRIEAYKGQEDKAKQSIAYAIMKDERLAIKS